MTQDSKDQKQQSNRNRLEWLKFRLYKQGEKVIFLPNEQHSEQDPNSQLVLSQIRFNQVDKVFGNGFVYKAIIMISIVGRRNVSHPLLLNCYCAK